MRTHYTKKKLKEIFVRNWGNEYSYKKILQKNIIKQTKTSKTKINI